MPYAAPYTPQYAAPAPPPPGWATPPALVPGAAKSGLDPWRVRGWRGGGATALRILTGLALLAAVVATGSGAGWADDRASLKNERAHYVEVRGIVRTDQQGDPEFSGQVPDYGTVVVPLAGSADDDDVYPGSDLTLLVAPGDRTDYVLPSERAAPGETLAALVVASLVAAALAVAALLVHRNRHGDEAAVRHVAVPLAATEPPWPLRHEIGARPAGIALRLLAAAALTATAIPAAVAASHQIHQPLAEVVTTGTVVPGSDDAGHETRSVRFYDTRTQGENVRPLTPAERARGVRDGDSIEVRYVSPGANVGHGGAVMLFAWAVVAALGALLLVRRALFWPYRLARAQREPARPVEITAWVRVVRRHAWLVISPPGATRPRQAIAVPVVVDNALPAALTGTLYVHGRLKAGHAVILRAPSGVALVPTGPARPAWLAELTLVGVGPLLPPAPYAAWGYAPSW
jgi:hypothetical protein